MYEIFYNLRAEPFRLSPDHRFCYEHKGYAKARAYMAYAFMRAEGFVMVTGRPGTGKTTLIGDLIESLAKDNVTTANLVCTQLQADDLLKTVAYSFGVGSEGLDKAELLQRLNTLFHNWHRDGRRALLIVDEAQDLSITAMEELRLLTNIQVDGQPLLQIFLLGQPELRDLILSPPMEQVHQRIVAASHLEALELEETEAYVRHRLEAVGWCGDPALSRAIFPLIYKFSEGVPRRINLICSRLFLHGGVEQRHQIGVQDVRVVISELQAENLAAGSRLSDTDFAVEDEFEQVAGIAEAESAESEVVQAPAAVRLRAVSNDPSMAPDRAPVENAPKPKKKDIPIAIAIPAATTYSPLVADVELSPADPGGHKTNPAIPDEERPVAADPGQVSRARPSGTRDDSGRPADQPARRQREGKPVKRQAKGKRIGAWAVFTVFIVSLFLFLGVFVTRPSLLSDLQSNLLALWRGVVSVQSTPVTIDTDSLPTYRVDEGSGPARVWPGDDFSGADPIKPAIEPEPEPEPVSSPVAESMEVDPGEVKQMPEARITEDVEVASPLEGELSISDSGEVSVVSSGWEGERTPLDEAAVSELEQVLFVSFTFDSVNLSPDSQIVLDQVLETMRQSHNGIASITGFSDNRGEDAYNLELSRQRANVVKQYLVDGGVRRERLQVEGRGALYDYIDADISGSKLEIKEYRIVQIRIGSGTVSTDSY